MKKQKIIIACVAIFAGLNMLFAGEQSRDNTQLANKIVEKLSTDVVLTDSQKTVLLQAATLYFKRRNIASQKSGDEIIQEKKNAETAYKAVLDSILTPEQQAILKEKKAEKLKEAQNHK
jgi:hypothetical protein